ncbi:sodium:proton exchanger family protein [Campylobacter blaseri]|uniref:Sodium:proton antiporter n=1 Tax=Campylobacter blaseri TaxID=2042961 RepID=A0A2P8R3Y0_9BACT|nr:cation:proton antiporter [Campylobacter blaseri]PSM53224.1 sodium:proton antiporter [Campylobacter blaseri]PSM54690.1 sodium:proton antiporter [Campylobacter blaseri]QKF86828.1 sodium:proton exchanger family protein [Campylobacter blaseri]
MSEISILITLAFIIFASPYIAKIIKIPTAPTEILLGILFGAIGLLQDNASFKVVADIGFYYLMFLAGTEVNLKVFITTKREILKKSILFLALLYVLSTIAIFTFDINKIFIIITPLISIGILSTLYKEYGKDEEWLNMAMIVGIIGEVVSIALLTVFSAYLKYGFGTGLFINLSALIGFLVVTTLIFNGLEILFWWYPSVKKILMPSYDKEEKDIRLSMALFCFVIAITIMLHLKVVIGAFIAGTFIPTFFEHKKDLPHKLSSFGFGFLVPIFFVYIGSTVNLEALLNIEILKNMILITIGMIIVRLIASTIFIKNLGSKGIILFGFSLSIPLTLLIATAAIGYETNYISKDLYYSFILASLFQAIVCMVFIKIVSALKLDKNSN